jgi:hypothetical protein
MFQKLDLPKVRDFSLGHEKARDGKTYKEYYYVDEDGVSKKYERELQNEFLESIAVDSLKSMTIFDITNHNKLSAIEGLTECTQLQEFYARGTDSLRALTLPATTSLRKLYLGKSLVQLNLNELTGIDTFELEGADAMEKLFIKNCGDYMATRSYDIALQVLPSLENAYDPDYNNNICQLTGIKWDNCTAEHLERLYNINAQLSGTINLTNALNNTLKVKLVDKYGAIDDPNNPLYITYIQNDLTDIIMPSKIYIYEPGDTKLTFTYKPTGGNTYSHAEWTLTGAGDYASIDSATGVITRSNREANESTPPATLKVKVFQIPDKNGRERPSLESNNVSVYFYERHAKPGDIVYHDGSFSDEKDSTKTAVGVCFYVDPNDNKNRLMVALKNIYRKTTTEGYKWGIGYGSHYTTSDGEVYYGSPQINPEDYGFETMQQIIDVPSIPNVVEHGGNYTTAEQMLNDEEYRNASTLDKFAAFSFSSCMGNIGWDVAKEDITIDYNKVIEAGKTYPVGYIYTMAMIQRRDHFVSRIPGLEITGTVGRTSEYSELFNDFTRAEGVKIGDWTEGASTYMYPAASLAYAYEPGGEGTIVGLADKFKKRNWFIPASGEVVRISYYMRQYYVNDSEYEGANAFKFAIDEKILETAGWLTSPTAGTTVLSSTEYQSNAQKFVAVTTTGISSTTGSGSATTYTGICGGANKYDGARLRPICRF